MKWTIGILVAATAGVLLFHFLFFWMNFSVDTYYYWALGNYFKTGSYHYDEAFMPQFEKPPTVSPPAYGLLLAITEYLPKPDIFLHAFQLLFLAGIGICVYKSLRSYTSMWMAAAVGCAMILIPGNLIFASLTLTEIGAEFLIALFAYYLLEYVRTNKQSHLSIATSLGFAVTLWKYGFILFGLFGLFLLFRAKPKTVTPYFVAAAGGFVVLFWVFVNHQVTGVWGLSNYGNIRLWNQIVTEGRALPDEQSGAMIEIRRIVPLKTDLLKPYYDVMYSVLPRVGNSMSETDRIMGHVATDAVLEHPITYLTTAGRLFLQLHGPGTPFWEDTFLFNRRTYTPYCGKLGQFKMCNPIIKLPTTFVIWDRFLNVSIAFYYSIFPFIATFLFLPSLGYLLLGRNKAERTVSVLYILGILPVIFYEHLDQRFIVPFYPLMALVLTFSFHKIYKTALSRRSKSDRLG